MLLAFVTITLFGFSSAVDELKALRFGQTTEDYIEWRQDMSTATREVSVCSWLRKRFDRPYPIVFVYDAYNNPQDYGIIVGDNGYFNWFVGTHLKIQSKFNVPHGEWFHVCWVWSYSSQTTKVYLNGKNVGSVTTNKRELTTEGVIRLGNRSGYKGNIFGGDIYKLNVFTSALIESVILKMASDICSDEEKLTANRIIKWEEIVSKERTGLVVEVPIESDCRPNTEVQSNISEERIRLLEEESIATKELLNKNTQGLRTIEGYLGGTLGNAMNRILERLYAAEKQLNATQLELAGTKSVISQLLTQQEED